MPARPSRGDGSIERGASYRLGYVAVDDDDLAAIRSRPARRITRTTPPPASAWCQGNGRLPVRWTVGAGYVRRESGDLDNVFEAPISARHRLSCEPASAPRPVSATKISMLSQSDVLRDANGVPIIRRRPPGRGPETGPRLTGFDSDGLIYDGGIIWRPGPRTELRPAPAALRRHDRHGSLRHHFPRGLGLVRQRL